MPVKIFLCYARQDKKMLAELQNHLAGRRRDGTIETWCDQDIKAGREREPEIIRQLNTSHIILLLISSDFLASDYCQKQMKRALERHSSEEAYVIPVILRPCNWQDQPFSKLQPLPRDGKAVVKWTDKDDAFVDITNEIIDVIEEITIQEEIALQEEQLKKKPLTTSSTIPFGTNPTKSLRKKALLIVTGGRVLPDILMLHYLQPELVVIIAPQEGWLYQKILTDVTRTLPSCTVQIIANIDAFDFNACMQACVEACLSYPEWDWTFTTSSSSKIMSLAAYEIAKQRNIPLWLIDVMHEKVASLVRDIEVDTHRFFHITVDKYMKSYGYTIADDRSANDYHQSKLLAWSNVMQELILSPDTEIIHNLLKATPLTNRPVRVMLHPELKTSALLQSLVQNGLLEITQDSDDHKISCSMSYESAHFLMGDWLAFWVWHEVIKAGVADDCRWGFRIRNGQVQFDIDLVIIFKTRLLLVECKTAPNAFKDTQLARLDSTANLLGGGYVSKFFITNQRGAGDMFKSFCEKARLRNIVVITKEDLPNIATILKHEITAPTYVRI